MPPSTAQPDPLSRWRRHRRRCSRQWWLYLAAAAVSAGLFALNFRRGDTAALVCLMLIALLALRGAWKSDRQIQACDREIASRQIPPESSPPINKQRL